MNLQINLNNKIALITGASRGIGRSISLALASAGAHTILTARDEKLLHKVEEEITRKGGKATAIPTDFSKEQDILSLFKIIKDKWGKLDIVINNASIGIFGKFVDFAIEDFDKIMSVNLRSVYLCCQQALKIMIPHKSGYIINIASVQGIKAYPNHSAYAVSKHGVMGLTKALAIEAKEHGIRVSVILPGGVDTDFIRAARPDLDVSELMHPEDIARTVLFLFSLSDRAMVDQIVVRRTKSSAYF